MAARLRMLAVGTRMPGWVQTGFAEYQKRLPRDYALELREIPLSRRAGTQAVGEEGDALLASLAGEELVVALDVQGKTWDTMEFAEHMRAWHDQSRRVAFLIGGPDGLSPPCRERADFSLSLSRLTMPHPLVRVFLAEQIYRAWSIIHAHPYHR